MTATHCSSGRKTPAITLSFLAATLAFTWLGWSGNAALAQTSTAAGMRVAAEAQETAEAQQTAQAPKITPKITEDEAVQIALKAVAGQRTKKSVTIERQRGKTVYVVEIIATEDIGTGVETDVFIDPMTGEVVGTEK